MIVCAATNNAGKLKELRRILTRCGHEVKSLRELGVTLDPEETGTTFAENAKIKAEAFCKATNTAHRTYAELADAEKDAISHRGRAMEKLEAELAAFLGE